MTALELRGVTRRLGKRLVLDGVALRFDAPGTLVIRGENGAGKSTLLRIVAGVLDFDAGEVLIGGASLRRDRVRALRALGYVPEAPELPDRLTPRDLAALTASLRRAVDRGPARFTALLEQVGAASFADRPLGGLSLGQRRRSLLAAALVGDPLVLALDEPTNGLDVSGVALLKQLLADRVAAGLANVVATHDDAFARDVATRTVTLAAGALR